MYTLNKECQAYYGSDVQLLQLLMVTVQELS